MGVLIMFWTCFIMHVLSVGGLFAFSARGQSGVAISAAVASAIFLTCARHYLRILDKEYQSDKRNNKH
jgi:hypothetical protein